MCAQHFRYLQVAFFALTACRFQAAGLGDTEGMSEQNVAHHSCLDDDASFVQLKSNAMAHPSQARSPLPPPPAAGIDTDLAGRCAALMAQLTYSLRSLSHVRGASSLFGAFAAITAFLAILAFYVTLKSMSDTRQSVQQTSNMSLSGCDLDSCATLSGSQGQVANGGAHSQQYSRSGATTLTLVASPGPQDIHGSVAGSGTVSSLRPSALDRPTDGSPTLARVLSPGPQSQKSSVMSLASDRRGTFGSSASEALADNHEIRLKIPMLFMEDGVTNVKVVDDVGFEKFVVKVRPSSFANTCRQGVKVWHADVRAYLQVYAAGRGGTLQEMFLCAVCGGGKKRACHVHHESGQLYGTIAEDLAFPSSEYVVGSTYTLRSAGDNSRFLTIIRRKDHGIQVLSPPNILADVTERVDEDCYDSVCQPGTDAIQVVLMILGMDRLVDLARHNPRRPRRLGDANSSSSPSS